MAIVTGHVLTEEARHHNRKVERWALCTHGVAGCHDGSTGVPG